MEALLRPEVIKVIMLKCGELGQQLTAKQVEAVIKSCMWMRDTLAGGGR